MNELLLIADVLSALCLLAFIWAIWSELDPSCDVSEWLVGSVSVLALGYSAALCGFDAWTRLSLLMGA